MDKSDVVDSKLLLKQVNEQLERLTQQMEDMETYKDDEG